MQKHVSALYVEFFRIWRGLQPGAKHPVCLTSINNHPITKADFIVNINLLSRGCEGIGGNIKLRYYKPKQGNLCLKIRISNKFGVLEYWRVGVTAKGLISVFSILQYSNTPVSSKIETFKAFRQDSITLIWSIGP
jgi:hypothetical protein